MQLLPWARALGVRCRHYLASAADVVAAHRILAACVAGVFACAALAVIVPVALVLAHVYGEDANLPDPGPFARFEFPAIGHVYDANGQPLIALAHEHRSISRYEDIPAVVRDAILASEDKRFFAHNGVDYSTIPRVLLRIRMRTLVARLFRNPFDEADSPAIFPQGGSTITQQLVRGYFLKGLTAGENSRSLRGIGRLTRSVSYVLGARNANMIARKAEELRLSIWIETEMTRRFGSKRRAKEEIARVQDGLRGVVRLPTGTAHTLDARAFAIPVMGKTGTTNDFRDALFVGSTYGVDGITVAVRVGFDDNRSLGARETGGRVALPVFRELMLKVYGDGIVGPVPRFPVPMEQRITEYLNGPAPAVAVADAPVAATTQPRTPASPGELEWLRRNGRVSD